MTRKITFYQFLGYFFVALGVLPVGMAFDSNPPKKPPLLPQVRLVPGGMFLCGGASSPSYLPVISAGWQGTTLSLAPEPQASSKRPQPPLHAALALVREGLFWGVSELFHSS